jgi:DNA helicase-2/ATP-dependent DNA helicase PcrA
LQDYISQLNEAQRAPVLQKNGPMIVIAGAGSGKTRVLTLRIAYLMQQGVDPFNILSLTFTNKAAREMQKRIANIVGASESKALWMGTFHSVFARLLRIEADKLGYPNNFTIYDAQDSQRLTSAIIKEMGLDKDVYKYKQIFSRISSMKNSLITVRAYFNDAELQEADAMARRPRFGDIYKEYCERCFKAGAMDFDDLLLKTNELINRFPEVLAKYQNRFQYILVDEYQDTNHSQYLIIKALSDKFQNICVVGDDAQSIYAFRGANINNILNFQRDYDDVKAYRLEQNYRSTKNIVEAANSIIAKNKTKLDKVVWTANDDGPKIIVHRLMSDAEEGRYVASSIWDNKMQHQLANDRFAILYRTNAQSRAMEDALRKRDIPYRIYGGLSFYQRKEVKDVLSYLRLIVNPKDEEALKRVINYPARGIGQTTIDRLIIAAKEHDRSIFEVMQHIRSLDIGIQSSAKTKLENFVIMIKSFQALEDTQNVFELTEHVIKKSAILSELKKDGSQEGISRIENIEELLNGMRDFVEGQKEVDQARGSLAEFLEDVALATDLDNDKGTDDRVSLMTIHLAKGLEFEYVYIVGMEEELFPSGMSMSSREDLEEERRLFYVALTRAEHQAYLTYTLSRYRWGKLVDAEPSRFINEIDGDYLEYTTPPDNYKYKPLLEMDLWDEPDKSKLRQNKPTSSAAPTVNKPNEEQIRKLRKMRPLTETTNSNAPAGFEGNLQAGTRVAHARFGRGTVVSIEGSGTEKKAEIDFEIGGLKKLLLRFAKLDVLE